MKCGAYSGSISVRSWTYICLFLIKTSPFTSVVQEMSSEGLTLGLCWIYTFFRVVLGSQSLDQLLVLFDSLFFYKTVMTECFSPLNNKGKNQLKICFKCFRFTIGGGGRMIHSLALYLYCVHKYKHTLCRL